MMMMTMMMMMVCWVRERLGLGFPACATMCMRQGFSEQACRKFRCLCRCVTYIDCAEALRIFCSSAPKALCPKKSIEWTPTHWSSDPPHAFVTKSEMPPGLCHCPCDLGSFLPGKLPMPMECTSSGKPLGKKSGALNAPLASIMTPYSRPAAAHASTLLYFNSSDAEPRQTGCNTRKSSTVHMRICNKHYAP